jgi:hypothetical protein
VKVEFCALGVPRPPGPYTAVTSASAQLLPSMLLLSSAGFFSSREIPFCAEMAADAYYVRSIVSVSVPYTRAILNASRLFAKAIVAP